MAHPKMWQKPERRRKGVVMDEETGREYDYSNIAQPVPYVAAPSRRTAQGGGFSRDSVLKAVARMRASHKMRMAVFEVVFRRRSPSQISKRFQVGTRALNKAATRVRNDIRGRVQKPNENAASSVVVGIPCT
jgi:hypothetical protein